MQGPGFPTKSQWISEWLFGVFNFPKNKLKYFWWISALEFKKLFNIIMHYLLILGQKFIKFFLRLFFGKLKTLKSHSEIHWPLKRDIHAFILSFCNKGLKLEKTNCFRSTTSDIPIPTGRGPWWKILTFQLKLWLEKRRHQNRVGKVVSYLFSLTFLLKC